MPPRALSSEEVDAFRAELCRVAARRFAESGYDGVTLRGLAAELGCSPMTPYRYFRNKEDIFAAVRVRAMEPFIARMREVVAAAPDPVERLRAIGRAYVQFARDEPESFRIMFDLLQPELDEHPEVAEQTERARGVLLDTVRALLASGRVEASQPAETLAHLCWALVHGLATLHLAGRLTRERSIDELIEPALDNLLRGAGLREDRRA